MGFREEGFWLQLRRDGTEWWDPQLYVRDGLNCRHDQSGGSGHERREKTFLEG